MDVQFACVPYAPVERPSIALGLLKASLQREGIASSVRYDNFDFAEMIGLDVYAFLRTCSHGDLAAEWTFAGAAFPDFHPDHESYLATVREEVHCKIGAARTRFYLSGRAVEDVLRGVRARAAAFIDRTAEAILEQSPRVVACSSVFQQHCASLALLRRVRDLDPEVVTLLGGPNCEAEMGRVTHESFPWVDYVVSGEAELLLPDLCRRIFEHGREVDPAELPEGVFAPAHRRRPEAPLGSSRAMVHDLDRSPTPDYGDYFRTLQESPLRDVIQPGILIETSRGCWWGQKKPCVFCAVNGLGMRYRSKSPSRVAGELEHLSESYGLRNVEAVDNILNLAYVDSLFPRLATASPPWTLAYEVPATLQRHHMQRLARAGVRWIQPGIESMHDDALRTLGKGNRVWMNIQLLKWGREFGVNVFWLFLCRFPGEHDEWNVEMAAWLPLLFHLQPPAVFNPISFGRFSQHQQHPEDYGLRLKPPRTYAHVYPLTGEAIDRLAFWFEDDRLTIHTAPSAGQAALLRVIFEWQAAFQKTAAGEAGLVVEPTDDGVRILDSRPCAVASEIRLTGLACAVFTLCDAAPTRERLRAQLEAERGTPVSQEDIAPIIADLKEQKLLLEIGTRCISLAVRKPAAPITARFPGGRVDRMKVLAKAKADAERTPHMWPRDMKIEEAYSLRTAGR